MINVAIIEDNNTIREGVKEFLNVTDKYRCIGDYSDCESFLENLPVLNPDIILMDIILPGISGIEGIKEIKKIIDDPKIIVLTIFSENENLFEALLSGACGYLEKKTPPSQMLKLIEEVYQGKSYMNSFVARSILNFFPSKRNHTNKGSDKLNQSEFSILNNLVEGKSPKAIADYLHITRDAVHFQFFNIYQKLHREFELKNSTLV